MKNDYLAFQNMYMYSSRFNISFFAMESKTKEHLNKISKEIVKNSYEFCQKEEKEGIQISLKKCLLRTELISGLNKRTVQRVLR